MQPTLNTRNVHNTGENNNPAGTWGEVISHDRDNVLAILDSAGKFMKNGWSRRFAWSLLSRLMYVLVYMPFGRYIKESDYIADHVGRGRAQFAFLQRLYTWAHAGCTTCIVWDPTAEQMVHFRSLDWGETPGEPSVGFTQALADASRVFEFVDSQGNVNFKSAGIAGMVGVLTAVKPGAFSLAINYAPWKKFSAGFRTDPAFLMRDLLTDNTITTFAAAKAQILKWPVSSPVFISLCGIRASEATIIEFGDKAPWPRDIGTNNFLIQTNHFDIESPFKVQNGSFVMAPLPGKSWDDYTLVESSLKRLQDLEAVLTGYLDKPDNLEKALLAGYSVAPIWNAETTQWVMMTPATGNLCLWRR